MKNKINEQRALIERLNKGMEKARKNNCASQSEFYAPAIEQAKKELAKLIKEQGNE